LKGNGKQVTVREKRAFIKIARAVRTDIRGKKTKKEGGGGRTVIKKERPAR